MIPQALHLGQLNPLSGVPASGPGRFAVEPILFRGCEYEAKSYTSRRFTLALKGDNMTKQASDYTDDELDATWVTYQTQGTSACPRCGAVVAFELADDSVKGAAAPIVTVSCAGCGRRGVFDPGERNTSEQDPV